MNRIFISFLVLALSASFISCAPSAETQQSNSSDTGDQKYPSWYRSGQVVSNDSLFIGYGTALAEDESTAGEKAVAQASRNLKSAIGEKLEDIRSEASGEMGSEAGVDSPQFILTLRKAENVIARVASQSQIETEAVDKYNGYRGFAEVTVPKEELLEQIGNRLSANQKAWNALQESQAFEKF